MKVNKLAQLLVTLPDEQQDLPVKILLPSGKSYHIDEIFVFKSGWVAVLGSKHKEKPEIVVTIDQGGFNLPRDEKIKAMWKEGYSRKEIGEMFDLNYQQVYAITGPNKK